jgi:hypothetical protein
VIGVHHENVMHSETGLISAGKKQTKKNAAEAAFKLGDPSMKSHFSH